MVTEAEAKQLTQQAIQSISNYRLTIKKKFDEFEHVFEDFKIAKADYEAFKKSNLAKSMSTVRPEAARLKKLLENYSKKEAELERETRAIRVAKNPAALKRLAEEKKELKSEIAVTHTKLEKVQVLEGKFTSELSTYRTRAMTGKTEVIKLGESFLELVETTKERLRAPVLSFVSAERDSAIKDFESRETFVKSAIGIAELFKP